MVWILHTPYEGALPTGGFGRWFPQARLTVSPGLCVGDRPCALATPCGSFLESSWIAAGCPLGTPERSPGGASGTKAGSRGVGVKQVAFISFQKCFFQNENLFTLMAR